MKALPTSAALLLAFGLGAACAPKRPSAERPRASLISELALAPAYLSPAVWRYHPPEHARVNATRDLGDGRTLFAGKRGERWVYHERTRRLEAGSSLAPEDLIAILELPSGGFAFVGESGTSYESKTPLGAFFRSSAPADPLLRVSAAGHVIIGVKRDRGLLRSADGAASWQSVGPKGAGFVDVALAEGGHGLALTAPEALYATSDYGATWTLLSSAPSLGATSFARSIDGAILVVTALGPRRYVPGDATPFQALPAQAQEKKNPFGSPSRGPNAGAIAEGRALMLGAQYVEVTPPAERSTDWELHRGPLDGKLEARRLPELKGCKAARLAAFDRFMTVACFRGGSEGTQRIEFFRSESRGDDWQREPFVAEGSLASFRMAMGAGGSLIVTGICSTPSAGCSPIGVFHRRPVKTRAAAAERAPGKRVHRAATAELELASSATPSLAEAATALAFSPDGRYAYAVGRRTKTGAFAIFVSRDGGASFEAEEIGLVPADSDDDGEERWERAGSGLRVDSLSVAEDGALALVLTRRRAATLVVLDEEGRVVSSASAPDERSMIGAAGMRALALSPGTREVWESLDGGGTWTPLGRFPLELCREGESCEVPVRCAALGCAIGHEISRIGWGGQADDDGGLLPPPASHALDLGDKRLRAPIACTLEETPWRALSGVRSAPTAADAAIGRAAWFADGVDESTASVSLHEAIAGTRRIETRALLRPVARPENYALIALDQVEGVAALRYQVPEVREGDARLRNVEVAWANLLENRLVQTRVADGGPYAPGDYTGGDEGVRRAAPSLVSITQGGLYVRLHQAAGDRQDTLFLDGRGVQVVPKVDWPSVAMKSGRAEMVHVDGAHVPVLLLGGGRVIVRAERAADGWSFSAFTLGVSEPSRFGLIQNHNIAYAGGRAGIHAEEFDPLEMRAQGRVFTVRASGPVVDPPVAVPTQLSLADRPNRCTAEERAKTPRVVVPYHAGTRHPLIVSEGNEPPRAFLTMAAVLHGTPQSACAAAFDAEPVSLEGQATVRSERAILPLDDLEHAYLFRVVNRPGAQDPRVEYRLMSCRFDPGVELPPEVYRAPGTSVPRR